MFTRTLIKYKYGFRRIMCKVFGIRLIESMLKKVFLSQSLGLDLQE